jgi:hypothetical protein
MKTAKLGAIFLVAIMAMTAIGAAYAHWEETLTVRGIMETDNIDVAFYCEDSNDDPDDNLASRLDPDSCGDWISRSWVGQRRNKDVGWMDVVVPADNNNWLDITIGDAYPCYFAHAFWCVKNYGSVPVLIHSINLHNISFKWTDPVTGEVVDEDWIVDINLDGMAGTKYYVNISKVNDQWIAEIVEGPVQEPWAYDFFIMPTGQFCIDIQLDPQMWMEGGDDPSNHMESGYENELEQDLCVHFENGCRQLAIYDFTLEVVYYNWPHYVNDPPWA